MRFWREHLRGRRFDVAISPRWDVDEQHATLLCLLADARERVGYTEQTSEGKRRFNRGFDQAFDVCLPAGPVQHEVLRNLAIVTALGGTIADTSLDIHLTWEDWDKACSWWRLLPRDTVVVGLGIGAQCAGRRWPLERYAATIRGLAKHMTVQPVITCAPGERDEAVRLAAMLPMEPILATGGELREVCAVLEACDLFIGNDSGAAHLAAAMKCRVIVISRHPRSGDANHPNSTVRFGPFCEHARVLQPDEGLDECSSHCRRGDPHCINAVQPKAVVEAALAMLVDVMPEKARIAGSRFATSVCGTEKTVVAAGDSRRGDGSRSGRLVKSIFSGAAARVTSVVVGMFSLPMAVRYLGAERYGVWATITTTVVWINLLDLGIASTLSNAISRAYARADKRAAAVAVSNALFVSCAVALGGGVLLAACLRFVDWTLFFNLRSTPAAREIQRTIGTAGLLMLVGLPANLVHKLLAGYQEVHISNAIVCAGLLCSVAGLACGIAAHASMPLLFLMSTGFITAGSATGLLVVVLAKKPWLRPRIKLLRTRAMGELLASGFSFFVIQIAAVVVFSSDNLVVSHYLGAAEVTPYSVAWRLVGAGAVLQSLVFPALWPAYAEAHARGELAWIRRTFAWVMKTTVAMNVAYALLLVGFGRGLIRWWAGAAAVPSQQLLGAMAVWSVISGCMTVESCLLGALNRTRLQAVLSIVAAAVNLGISMLLVTRIGALGVILGTILSYVLVLIVPQTLMVREALFAQCVRGTEIAGNAAVLASGAGEAEDAQCTVLVLRDM